jgi:hypothetical protein
MLGGIGCLFSLFPLAHVAMGIAMLNGHMSGPRSRGQEFPSEMGWIFIIMGVAFIVMGLTISILLLFAGNKLAKHRSHLFCMIVAGISCVGFPLGTALGVFTIIVLQRESVKTLFKQSNEG